ncbi:MAG: hypothetical protein WA945_01660 [Arcobacteraceae bacterium]
MNILKELYNYIDEFNQYTDEDFEIDSIRIEFKKRYKKEKLEELGNWSKINKNDKKIMDKLKKRLEAEEVTSALQLEKYNIYYYNSNTDRPRYNNAIMVIFGLKQYNKDLTLKENVPQHLVDKIISILKNVSNIDLCLDIKHKPNFEALNSRFELKQYFDKHLKCFLNTYYINDTHILMIDKVIFYDKAYKNSLDCILWRIEATISIPNIKELALPLHEFKQITDLAKGNR